VRIGALGAGLDAGNDALNPAPACGTTWLSSQHVAARDVLHIYRKRRPGQLRDVSWLAPVLTRLCDLGDYEAPC
jgi:capsid protein